MNYQPERKLIAEFGRFLDRKGLVAGCDGNLSLRVEENRILVTPSGFSKGRLSENDLVLVDLDGRPVNGTGKPSSETAMHLFVYESRPDINACCHAHPVYATAFAVIGKELPWDILPEVVLTVGHIPLTNFAPPGTDAVPRSLEPYIADHEAFLLKSHGVLTLGKTMETAINRMETVEHLARIAYIAGQMGTLNSLDRAEIKRLQGVSKTHSERPDYD
nr:class II aldolase/adducin family protein [candidate division Zixibacteria bacterium]